MINAVQLQAAERDPVCAIVTKRLPVGGPAPANLLNAIPEAVKAAEEMGSQALFQLFHAGPGVADKIRTLTGDGMYTPRVIWLAPGALAVLETVEGSAACQNMLFLKAENGNLVMTPGPWSMSRPGAGCDGDQLWFGQIGDRAYVVEYAPAGDRAERFMASAWRDGTWSQPCTLTETYTVKLALDRGYCAAKADCTALQPLALRQAKTAEAKQDNEVLALDFAPQEPQPVATTGMPSNIPTFDDPAAIPYTAFYNPRSFHLVRSGEALVGAVGHGHFGWRDYDGWLVGFWQDGSYVPVAGFQVRREPESVTSIGVSP